MDRFFRDIPDDKIEEGDQIAFLAGFHGKGNSNWEDLLKSDRVLIISEAGAGKTFECRSKRDAMWAAGDAAFFLELAELSRTSVLEMFSPAEEKRFEAWRIAQSETAIFFLDSYDELKLTLGSFEQALKRLAKAIDGQLGRAKIVITSRPIPIDRRLFGQILPILEPDTDQASGEVFADIVMNGRKKNNNKENVPLAWRNVALMPLVEEQIRDMALSQGVVDPNELMADIKKRNAEEFTRRPQDLIELCADWRDHRRIRTHREQVTSNIKVKLAARIDRNEKASLSQERAIDGASRLALAVLLTRKLTLRHSAAADQGEATHAALDPAKILPDWTVDERTTLLERPLFGFASYGRVRFHHRSVVEYLAGERIKALIGRGMSMKAVKRLLFATTAQGAHVVRPSMAPVAAWIALSDDGVFEEIQRREPSILLNFGDPESLRPSQRATVLRTFVNRYGFGGWRGLHIPSIQIHRFASIELDKEIQFLWDQGIENHEVREILLNIIEAASLTSCSGIAYQAALSQDVSYGERIDALNALATLRSDRLDTVLDFMETDVDHWPDRIVIWAVSCLFPDRISVERLCKLLGRINEPGDAAYGITSQLPEIVRSEILTDVTLDELRVRLTELIQMDLSWEKNWPHIFTKKSFLIPTLATVCLRQLQQHTATIDVIKSSVLCLRLTPRDYDQDEPSNKLRQAIEILSSLDRKIAFELDDDLMESLHPQPDSAKRYIRTSFYGPIRLTFDQDAGWIMDMLADKAIPTSKRAMLLDAAVRFWDGGNDRQAYLKSLTPLVEDIPELIDILDAASQPPKPDPESLKLEAQIAKQEKKSKRQDKDAHASWVKFWREVADNPDTAFAPDRAVDTAWNLWRAMERSGHDSRATGWNRRFIESNFGKVTADRLRAVLMAVWRKEVPTLRSERKKEEKNITLVRWQLGLAAITAEAEDPLWAEKLNQEEAQLAARYVPLDSNGFPAWLENLVISDGLSVDAVLGNDLSLELNEAISSGWHSMMLQNIDHAPTTIVSLFLPRLRSWLTANLNHLDLDGDNVAVANRLGRVVRILLKHGDENMRESLRTMAAQQLANGAKGPIGRVWLPVLMHLDTAAGIDILEKTMVPLPIVANGEAVNWFGSLFGDRHGDFLVSLNSLGFTPQQLLRLTRLGYQYVQVKDDVKHETVYTPDMRDHAERGRDAVLTALLGTTGVDGWNAKLSMVVDPLFSHFKDRVIALARERSAEESDTVVHDESDLLTLDSNGELPPMTRDEMFALLTDRLDDLDDLLLRDDSPRAAWALIEDETIMRQQIARELRYAAKFAYTVDQEAVTADNKETDIRLRSVRSDQQATIELKIGEKPRSAAELRRALKEQLVKKYMAPNNSRSGCLLITVANSRHWKHPETRKKINLAELIEMLNEEAEKIQVELGGQFRLIAKGLNLTPRLPVERQKNN